MQGDHVTSKGDSVRVLDLTGLDLQDPFIAVTTTFDDDEGTFANTAFEMVRAYGPGGRADTHRRREPQGRVETQPGLPYRRPGVRRGRRRRGRPAGRPPTRAPDRPAPTA